MLRRVLLSQLALFLSAHASAQESPFAEVSVSPEQVTVGEPITLRVSVYVPTWFAKPPVFPSFEIPNAVTRLPPNSSRPTTKRVGRETWSGITRSYQVYPLMGARFVLENQIIEIVAANPGSDPITTAAETGEIAFEALVPAGAETLDPYVAGKRLELTQTIDGETEALSVGDAVVVTYVAELDGLPAIFLPEIVAAGDIPGVSVYAEQPVVEDTVPARRTEKLTYVFNAGGDFEIPAVAIDWWNRDTGQIETAALPAQSLAIAGPPLDVAAPDEAEPRLPWWQIFIGAALLLLLLRLLVKRSADIRSRLEERELKRRSSEPFAWQEAKKAMASGDARRAHDEIVRWLFRLDPGSDSRSFAARCGDDTLREEMERMNRVLYAGSSDQPDLQRISRGLSSARKRCLAERRDAMEAALPPLNP